MGDPLILVKRLGDKLIRETPFAYRLEVAPVNRVFNQMHFVDFGRTFGLGRPAVAYAWTCLAAAEPLRLPVELEHSDSCRIWLNGSLVYENLGPRQVQLRFEERSLEMSHRLTLQLRAGANSLLIESATCGQEWRVYLQPPSGKGAVEQGTVYPDIGLRGVPYVEEKVADLTNWLVVGPFAQSWTGTPLIPASGSPVFGHMYRGLDAPVTWTAPKIELLGSMINPAPWGTNYQWNYHNGGVAWAMQNLAEASGEKKYSEYASRFCDYHLEGIPFVEYQVKTLNAVDSANHFIIDTSLLDFTLAPSLPFIYRLRREKSFANRELYVRWVEKMLHYALHEQVRLPGHDIYTRTTPVKYTTWVDDMFMGIPFLVQASQYVSEPALARACLDFAAHQVLEFNTQVWDEEAELYMHSRYYGNPAKLPHWSRCNGWAIWAMTEVLLHLPASHPKRAPILAHYRRHVNSLVRLQDRSGFWLNVLDRPDSPPEVSGTAIFTMAIARGLIHGWLEDSGLETVVNRGWQAVTSEIEPDGTVHKICMGTMCTQDVSYYIQRPFFDNDTHGLFAVLFAGIEVHQLARQRQVEKHQRNKTELVAVR